MQWLEGFGGSSVSLLIAPPCALRRLALGWYAIQVEAERVRSCHVNAYPQSRVLNHPDTCDQMEVAVNIGTREVGI